MSLLRRLLGLPAKVVGKPAAAEPKPIPPRPADWTMTLDDLFEQLQAGERDSIGSPEREWALDYQRSLLPEQTRYPRQGDVYESLQTRTVSYITNWNRPYSGDGEGQLLTGDRVWISDDPGEQQALGSYAHALDYPVLEQRMVAEDIRSSRSFTGFHFYFSTVELNTRFKLVATDYVPDKRSG